MDHSLNLVLDSSSLKYIDYPLYIYVYIYIYYVSIHIYIYINIDIISDYGMLEKVSL